MTGIQLSLLPPSKFQPSTAKDSSTVLLISEAIKQKVPYKIISKRYNVSLSTITNIKQKKVHKNLL